ncbi:MAG: recombinase family protein, partial [Chloroflexi bacterium]|nr:recombinase family protein [Chloroflexota bacterium]
GYTVTSELRDDCSGTIRMSDRSQGSVMLATLERKEADAVIVYTSDRLSRNLAHSLIMREQWQRAGVELHCVDRGKAEDTSESRLMQNVEVVIAEYEREKIRERTMRGMHAKAQSGRWVGNGHTPHGFARIGANKDARLMLDDYETSVVRRIFYEFVGAHGYQRKSANLIGETLTARRADTAQWRTWLVRRDDYAAVYR